MRISKLALRISEAEVIPKGYGLAYWDFPRQEGIFYLIPFNLLARFWLYLYYNIVHAWFPNKFEKMLLDAEFRGFKQGKTISEKAMDNYVEKLFKHFGQYKIY